MMTRKRALEHMQTALAATRTLARFPEGVHTESGLSVYLVQMDGVKEQVRIAAMWAQIAEALR